MRAFWSRQRSVQIARAARAFAGAAGLALAAALFVAGGQAQGQLAPSRSGTPGIRHLPEGDGWFAIRQLGSCLARAKREDAVELIATAPGSDEEGRRVHALIGRETSCLRNANQLILTTNFLRGSIAEALYLEAFDSPPPASPAESDAVEVRDLASFARCFALLRPELAHRLLSTTRLGTEQEREAMSAMGEALGLCLPAGLSLRLDPSGLRMELAEALYRRATAPTAPVDR